MKDYPDKMTPKQVRTFRDDVLNIVSQIPCGYVTTYGELLPCHRVVNNEGRTAPGWSRQRTLLESEGVAFKPNDHVDMQRHLWEPPLSE